MSIARLVVVAGGGLRTRRWFEEVRRLDFRFRTAEPLKRRVCRRCVTTRKTGLFRRRVRRSVLKRRTFVRFVRIPYRKTAVTTTSRESRARSDASDLRMTTPLVENSGTNFRRKIVFVRNVQYGARDRIGDAETCRSYVITFRYYYARTSKK